MVNNINKNQQLPLISTKTNNYLPFQQKPTTTSHTLCDKVCQGLATGLWFSPGTLVSSTNKTDHHNITEILLNLVLMHNNLAEALFFWYFCLYCYLIIQ
jgi:hypothetical protein